MIETLSLVASAVAAAGHLLFALAAGGAGGAIPRAFARVAFALAAWSAASFFDLLGTIGGEVPWIVALALPPYGIELASRLVGGSVRLEDRPGGGTRAVLALPAGNPVTEGNDPLAPPAPDPR